MMKKSNSVRDAFTFGLLGLGTKASFVAVPVVADDRLTRAQEERNRKRNRQATDESANDEQPTDQDRAA